MVLGSPQQRNLAEGVSMAEGIDRAAEVLRAVSDQLADQDITIAIEPLGPEETNFLCTADQGQTLIDAVGSPQVKLLLDVKAMSTESISISNLISSHIGNLVHFHANDPNRQGPGMGDLDFRPIMETLKEVNYGGWVSVEVFDYSPGIEKLASSSIKYLSSLLQQ
jgi:sugar phosphate isomerase/epimerase